MSDDLEKKPVEERKTVSDDDKRIARSGPAIYANRAIINLEHVVRIAFVEQSELGTEFRVAVAMPHETAIGLSNALKRLLVDIEKQLEAAQQLEAIKSEALDVMAGADASKGG